MSDNNNGDEQRTLSIYCMQFINKKMLKRSTKTRVYNI